MVHIARRVAGVRTGMKNTTPAMNVQRTLRFETCRIMNGLGDGRMKEVDGVTK